MAKPIKQYGSSGSAIAPTPMSSEQVDRLHVNADTNVRAESLHHTLGPGETQASSGSHTHDGGDSPLILEGFTITGSHSAGTSLTSIVACLVRLGAADNSTA